jgi:hypothetical protein
LSAALNHAMEGRFHALRADQKLNVPVVMTREEGLNGSFQ